MNSKHDTVVARLREATFLNANDAGAFARLGRACLETGRLPEAIEALQRAIRIAPGNAGARVDLGRAWLAAAEPEKAAFHLRRAIELEPGDASAAGPLLAQIECGAAEFSPAFVRTLFDQYAERFDAELVATLEYRAPEILRDLFARIAGVRKNALDVLDLGCGTGLSGRAFHDYARTLVGVDLSPRMAAKSRARGIYDRVIVGDMILALGETPASFDLVIAVDALGYVGDLAQVFRAAGRALRRPGWFAATVEENGSEGFALGPARRFRHGADYLRRAAEAAGFDLLALEKTVLRRDRGEPVAGLAFVLSA